MLSSRRNLRGQTLVEFALAITVILVLLFGVIDLSMAFHFHQKIVYQVNEAARFGSIYGSFSGPQLTLIRNIVRCGTPVSSCTNYNIPGIDAATITINRVELPERGLSETEPSPIPTRTHVVVRVQNYQYRFFTPFVSRLFTTPEIRVSHPMECEETAGCASLPTPTPTATPTP